MKYFNLVLRRRQFLRGLGLSALAVIGGNIEGIKALAHEKLRTKLTPTLYIPHGGGPCFFMEWTMGPRNTWDGMAQWLRQLGSSVSEVKPKALVVISAHWEEAEFTINSGTAPNLLYDYYGFPESTYKLEYRAPGSPDLASRIHDLLTERQIRSRLDRERGFDHGVFVPLKLVYPDADIPIVQVSLKKGLDPGQHIAFGKALAPLRSEGVLILGSGMSYHNLRHFGDINAAHDAAAFDTWLKNTVCHSDSNTRSQLLSEWPKAPSARAAHPREEHLIPLMVAAGAAGSDAGQQIYSEQIMGAAISGYQFG